MSPANGTLKSSETHLPRNTNCTANWLSHRLSLDRDAIGLDFTLCRNWSTSSLPDCDNSRLPRLALLAQIRKTDSSGSGHSFSNRFYILLGGSSMASSISGPVPNHSRDLYALHNRSYGVLRRLLENCLPAQCGLTIRSTGPIAACG